MTAPTSRRQPASSAPPSGKQAQAQAQRKAYDHRKTRAKVKSDGRQLYIPPDDNGISRSSLTRSQANDN